MYRYVVKAVEAVGLRVIDGVDVGGRPLDSALKQRIEDADALIALVTPQDDGEGKEVDPAFVLSEFHFAEGQQKPTVRVLHHSLEARGLGAGNEYIAFSSGNEADVIVKLLSTIAVWRRRHGRVARVRIEPEEIVIRYDESQGDRCEFQLISGVDGYEDYKPAMVWPEPGAAYAVLPKLRDSDRVRLRIIQGGNTWQTRHAINPFVGGVSLEKQS